MPRSKTSPWKYDRAAIRYVLEKEGLEAARARWPRQVVDTIARVLGLTKPYNAPAMTLTQEQVAQLGTKPDSVLAGEWGIAHSTVALARRLLGLRTPGQSWRRDRLRTSLDALTDAELCKPLSALTSATGLGIYVLIAERQRRNIRASPRGVSARVGLRERRRVAMHALRSAFPAITLDEMGEVFGLTRERVRQLEQAEEIETSNNRRSA